MKIDRLLSIVIYLLNRDIVNARELAGRYGVSIRTIQRDLETIDRSGIPVYSVQGPGGGYGIMESCKMDRQLLSSQDFYFILTALERVAETMADESVGPTLEKMKTLLPGHAGDFFARRNEKLSIDFSMLGGDPGGKAVFQTAKRAVDTERLLCFSYTSNKLESTERTVEPMTIAFHWRAWYLYGYCRLRQEYRLFRLSRIKNPAILDRGFRRREKSFATFICETPVWSGSGRMLDLRLKFKPEMSPLVEEYYEEKDCKTLPDGSLEVCTRMPEDGSLYAYILSFGHYVEVMEPAGLRKTIHDAARDILHIYE